MLVAVIDPAMLVTSINHAGSLSVLRAIVEEASMLLSGTVSVELAEKDMAPHTNDIDSVISMFWNVCVPPSYVTSTFSLTTVPPTFVSFMLVLLTILFVLFSTIPVLLTCVKPLYRHTLLSVKNPAVPDSIATVKSVLRVRDIDPSSDPDTKLSVAGHPSAARSYTWLSAPSTPLSKVIFTLTRCVSVAREYAVPKDGVATHDIWFSVPVYVICELL